MTDLEARFFTKRLSLASMVPGVPDEPVRCCVCDKVINACACTYDEMRAWLDAQPKIKVPKPAPNDPRCSRMRAHKERMLTRFIPRLTRQSMIGKWAREAFGDFEATHLPQRGLRLLEEAVEAYQACGGTKEMAHKLVDYVFGRPVGELSQELGGVSVTLLALAAAAGFDVDFFESKEVDRVLSKPLEFWMERNAKKNDAGLQEKKP